MIRVLVLLLFAISLNGFGQDEPQRNTKDFGLVGNVKSVKKRLYKPKDGTSATNTESRIFVTFMDRVDNYQLFNERGLLLQIGNLDKHDSIIVNQSITYNSKDSITEEVYYDNAGKNFRRNYFVYDDNGNLIESASIDASDAESSKITRYKYNPAGQLIEEAHSALDGSNAYRVETSYNKKGLWETITIYDTDGTIAEKQTCKYNKSGIPVEISYYGENAKFLYKCSSKYDTKDNSVETKITTTLGVEVLSYTDFLNANKQFVKKHKVTNDFEIKGYVQYKYNSKGVSVEEETYRPEGTLKNRNVYDDNRNLLEMNRFEQDGTIGYKSTFKYDTKNNPTEWVNYEKDGSKKSTTTYTYEYDSRGNWIKRVIFSDSEPALVTTREIEYY